MSTVSQDRDEDESIRRFARWEWLMQQVEEASREAEAYARLEDVLSHPDAARSWGSGQVHWEHREAA